ncbi:MAG: DUF1080 domain-containing protein, partial [Thermoguttaceae bacterium]|nr:DUF1080 domain-containing protein [Thermoguttaceae bacterium]
MRTAAVAALFLLVSTVLGGEDPRPATAGGVSEEEAREGFVPIFDGKSLSGWRGATGGYRAENGLLVCTPKG